MTADALSPRARALEALLGALDADADPTLAMLDAGEREALAAAAQPRRFDVAMLDAQILPAAREVAGGRAVTADGASLLHRLSSLGLVCAVAGRTGWWCVGPHLRETLLLTLASDGAGSGAPQRWLALHARLAEAFDARGADADLEALYHRLTLPGDDGARRWRMQYDDALARFDLARCESLLDLLAQRALPSPALASTWTSERLLLETRAGFADDYFRTSRYVQREALPFRFGPGAPEERMSLPAAVARLLATDTAFVLELHAPGGSGKTMGVRWLAARWCLPAGIPFARIDFDFLADAEHRLAPVFLLGKFIERLDLQLPGRPFFELLATIADVRRFDGEPRRPRADDAGPAADGDEAARQARLAGFLDEVIQRAASILAERPALPGLVLVLDTLEEAGLRHEIDLRSIVRAVDGLRRRLHAFRPDGARVVLVVSGRYTLAEQFPETFAEYAGHCVSGEVVPFTEAESRDYLTRRLTGIAEEPRPEVVAEVVARAHGSPFKLSLYADVLLASPRIGIEDLGGDVDVDMLYLVERVLKRLPDPALRWVLRYGVLARRFTRGFLEQVLLRRLARPLRGETTDDDPARDAVRHKDWLRLWMVASRGTGPDTDPDRLWKALRDFASASSWVSVDAGATDAVVIQPVVRHPMRRALAGGDERPAVQALHRDAVAWAQRRLREGDPAGRPEALADLTFHDFMARGDAAARRWEQRLDEYAPEGDCVVALASAVLSEDLLEPFPGTGPDRGVTPRVGDRTRARAQFALAQHHADAAGTAGVGVSAPVDAPLGGADLTRARVALARHDLLLPPDAPDGPRAVPLLVEGRLRLLLAVDDAQRAVALAQIEAALATRLPRDDRAQALLLLARAFSQAGDARAAEFAARWGRHAARTGDAESYVEWIVDQVSDEVSASRPRQAFRIVRDARERLRAGAFAASPTVDRRVARFRLDEIAVQVLAAARHPAEALKAFLARRGMAAPSEDASDGVLHAELLLGAGDALGARQRLLPLTQSREALETPAGLALPASEAARAASARRVRAGLVASHAALALGDLAGTLDAMAEVIAEQSRIGDRFGESLSRLHVVRLQMHEVGHLQKAEMQLRDREAVVVDDAPELRVETLLARAALHGVRGETSSQASRVAEARAGLEAVLPARWRVRVHVAVAGLACPAADHPRHLEDLCDVLALVDHGALRLHELRGLRHVAPLADVATRRAATLERLARLEPIAARHRWHPHDRAVATLRRVELLRMLGRHDQAVSELRRLAPALRALGPVLLWRDVALACDRLVLDPTVVLGEDWLATLVRRWGRQRPFCAMLQSEAAVRALHAGDLRRAGRLARRAMAPIEGQGQLPALWQLQALRVSLEAAADDESTTSVERRLLRRQYERLAAQLGQSIGPLPGGLLDPGPDRRDGPSPLPAVPSGDPGDTRPPPRPDVPPAARPAPHGQVPVPSSAPDPDAEPTPEPVLESLHFGNSVAFVDHLRRSAWRGDGLKGSSWAVPAPLRGILETVLQGGPAVVGARGLDPRRRDLGWLQAAPVLPPTFGALLDRASRPSSVLVESVQPALHGLPWELLVPPRAALPFALHPGIRRFWRGRAEDVLRMRTIALQRALGVIVDGVFGPRTGEALRRFCRDRGLDERADEDDLWKTVMAATLAPLERGGDVASVLLLQTSDAAAQASMRGHQVGSGDLLRRYLEAGVQVDTLSVGDLGQLHAALSARPRDLLHLATPISRSRTTGELSLQFSGRHEDSRSSSFEPETIARALFSLPADHVPALILVEPPRSTSREETVRQLLDRNEFAARLHAVADRLPVLAAGLAPPEEQHRYTDLFALAVRERWSAAQWLDRLRQIGRSSWDAAASPADVDLLELLPNAGAALFACEPWVRPGAAGAAPR